MYKIWNNIVEQTLIVRDDDEGSLLCPQLVDAVRHRAQRVDIEPRIRLVENAENRLEHRELEDLVSLLLTARKAGVYRAPQHRRIHIDELEPLLHEVGELQRVDLTLAARLADLVVGGAQEV